MTQQSQSDPEKDTYLEVWGDTVSSEHLLCSVLLGVGFATTVFLTAQWLLAESGIDPAMVGSYSLLIGLAACVTVAVVCARLFKPKRDLLETDTGANSRETAMDSMEAEIGPIGDPDEFPAAVLEEVKMLGLYDDFKQRHLHKNPQVMASPAEQVGK
ncbi:MULTISPECIES: hypothetical protein [Brachybacterium]|uniref:Uncharacterized protein n=2 Tax=Brachybacterium TaxID=43668 RepID=A0A426SN99_9MICO|nr:MULTISPECIES: hypothetical protein [Brachybacterium]MCT1437601.1 hypothetical protein [Brachybacterium paraconglomeratum]RRR19653.1 hypothetical protein DS079_05245 [Brachybacterium paraconglomeratum]GLI31328.1 hypothetical protein BCONGLO52_21690 [Brachybacterium conglomeratum]GLK04240.1 hypothetical protein GCM10017597_10390 [Brachybacterium conglomeratum]